MFALVECSWLLASRLAPLAHCTSFESLCNSVFWHRVAVCIILGHYYSVVWLPHVGWVFNMTLWLIVNKIWIQDWRSFSSTHSNNSRHEQSSPDHNRLNSRAPSAWSNAPQYLSLFWIAAIFTHSHVDKSIKTWKISLQSTFKTEKSVIDSPQSRFNYENLAVNRD